MVVSGKKNCCHGCENRTSECHATCKEYAEFAKRAEELRIQKYKAREYNNQLRLLQRDGYEKERRRHK